MRTIVEANPRQLGYVDPSRILFIAGAARRDHRASVRPLKYAAAGGGAYKKPVVQIDGVNMLYEVCLRPRFFLFGDAARRLATIVHELWHMAPAFDGTLAPERRHDRASVCAFNQQVRTMVDRLDPTSTEIFGFEGELTMTAWLSRPPSRVPIEVEHRMLYDERDLFEAIVTQRNHDE